MRLDGINPKPLNKMANELPSTSRNDAQLKEACQEFESMFLNQLLTSMRKTVPKTNLMAEEGEGGGEGGNRDEETYNSMLDTERAKAWAQAGGTGIGEILYEQLRKSKG